MISFGEEDPRGRVFLVASRVHAIIMTLTHVDHDYHLLDTVIFRLLSCEVIALISLHTSFFRRKSRCIVALRQWGVVSYHIEGTLST